MKEKVLNTIKKYNLIEDGDKIVLGVSGGPDSLAMLTILNEIRNEKLINFSIFVAHINHMIRDEANEEEEFVRKICEKNKIEFYSKRLDIHEFANNNKIGTEEAGRKVRYEFFNEVLKNTDSNKIAVAHNKKDRAETMILNLLRGSGINGLKGIEPKKNNIIRPIIEIDRDEIESYCEKNNLTPCIDKSNFENIYNRNKVRNIVIPYIEKEFNPNIVETLIRLSDLATEEDEFINNIALKTYENVLLEEIDKEVIFDLKLFNKQEILIRKKLILLAINKVRGNIQGIEKIHIEDIVKLCEKNIGNKFLEPNKNIKILIKKQKIFFLSLV